MIDTIINFILFGIMLISVYRKYRKINIPFLIVAIYAFIALMGVLYFPDFKIKNKIELWPFLYLILICWIYFFPVIKAKGVYKHCSDIPINYGIRTMLVIYVICAVITILDQFSVVKNAILGGQWLMMKSELYNGGSIGVRTNVITYIAGVYVSEFMYASLIYAFYTFTKSNISTKKSILFLLLAVIPYLMTCILYVYRGGFLTISYLTICIYLLYKKKMINKKRKVLITYLSIFASIIIIIVIAISLSRFDSVDGGVGSSFINYLGQPMLFFNAGIASIIKSYANGKYFFLNFLGLKKADVWLDAKYGILTDNGAALNTFIGCSIVDFGPILSIIIALFVSIYLFAIFNKNKIDFADLYLFAFYIEFLVLGVFHCTEGLSLKIFMVMTIYVSLKLMGKLKYNNI